MTELDLQYSSPEATQERLSDGHDHRFIMEVGGRLNVQRRSTPSTRTQLQMAREYGYIQVKGGSVRITNAGYELLTKPVNKLEPPTQAEFDAAVAKGVSVIE